MYVYKIGESVIVSTKKPDGDYLEVDKLPDGDGKLCTDLKTIWYAPWPEEPPKEAPIESKLRAQQDRIDFLEDCIAEMAQIVYSD